MAVTSEKGNSVLKWYADEMPVPYRGNSKEITLRIETS